MITPIRRSMLQLVTYISQAARSTCIYVPPRGFTSFDRGHLLCAVVNFRNCWHLLAVGRRMRMWNSMWAAGYTLSCFPSVWCASITARSPRMCHHIWFTSLQLISKLATHFPASHLCGVCRSRHNLPATLDRAIRCPSDVPHHLHHTKLDRCWYYQHLSELVTLSRPASVWASITHTGYAPHINTGIKEPTYCIPLISPDKKLH